MRVLIIGDSLEKNMLLNAMDMHEIISFTNPYEGFNWAKKAVFDLLIIDYYQGIFKETSFIKKLRDMDTIASPPVLIILSADEKEKLPTTFQIETLDFIERPLDLVTFSIRVKNMLKIRAHQIKITQQKDILEKTVDKMTRDLRADQERYELAALASNDGLWDWDLEKDRIFYSPRWCEMIGYKTLDLINMPTSWFNRVHPEDYNSLQAAIQTHLLGKSASLNWEYRLRHRNGFYQWMHVRAIAVRSQEEIPLRLVGTQTDITERKKLEQQLTYSAFHDTLTGLPNRSLLTERLQQAFFRYKRDIEARFALLFLDLDKFKDVNDTYGHEIGDILLQTIADRMKLSVRESDTPARLAGDEFVILLSYVSDSEEATVFADRLLKNLMAPVKAKERELFPSVSIGICMIDSTYKDFTEVLRDADIALYKAKTTGRSCRILFDKTFSENQNIDTKKDVISLKKNILQAIYNGDFDVFYQPIYSLNAHKLLGFEALLRWNHPRFGLIMPSDFIPQAEEENSIHELGKFVINKALYQLSEWQKDYADKLFMNINISSKQLYENDFIDTLLYAVNHYQLRPADVLLDLNEASFQGSFDMAEIILMRLKQHGFQIILDDYGSSQSSFQILTAIPFDYLKVDRSVIHTIKKKNSAQKTLEIIGSIATAMNVKVIYEGIETKEELSFLQKDDIFFGQGHLFGHPQKANTLQDLLTIHSAS